MQGVWTNDLFEYHGEFADFDRCGFGAKPGAAAAPADLLQRAERPEALRKPHRSTACRAGSGSRTRRTSSSSGVAPSSVSSRSWELRLDRRSRDLQHDLVRHHGRGDRSDAAGQGHQLVGGTAAQITDNLKRYKEAGLTMPLLWPPFADVPVAKTLDDLKRLKEEIMPQVDGM